jgi:hypothetical protein
MSGTKLFVFCPQVSKINVSNFACKLFPVKLLAKAFVDDLVIYLHFLFYLCLIGTGATLYLPQ